ncbi:hypothetical protein MMC18_000859 [Xylographa bjoerkii]|nr:hypothetical protein [Xylographa bjoerkii]
MVDEVTALVVPNVDELGIVLEELVLVTNDVEEVIPVVEVVVPGVDELGLVTNDVEQVVPVVGVVVPDVDELGLVTTDVEELVPVVKVVVPGVDELQIVVDEVDELEVHEVDELDELEEDDVELYEGDEVGCMVGVPFRSSNRLTHDSYEAPLGEPTYSHVAVHWLEYKAGKAAKLQRAQTSGRAWRSSTLTRRSGRRA